MSDDALMRKIRDLKEDAAALHELRRTLQAQLDAANAELDLWRSGALSPTVEDQGGVDAPSPAQQTIERSLND